MYTLKIQKLLNEVDKINLPEEKVKLILQAIQIADENQDKEWGYDLRLELINTERDLAFANESIPAFAWLLQTFDENPEVFNEKDFLWQYKWMISELYENPNISLAQIDAALDDFLVRLERNGYGKRAYYNEKVSEAVFQKDKPAIAKALQALNSAARDNMSDCQACEMDAEVSATILTDGFSKGEEMALPLLKKQYTCAHVPMRTLINLSYEANLLGEDKLAIDYANKAEEELSQMEYDSSILLSVMKLARFWAKTDIARAKSSLEKYIPIADGPINRTQLLFSIYLLETLESFPAGTIFNLQLPSSHLLYKENKNQFSKEELHDFYFPLAKKIAAKFDERNGNNNISSQFSVLNR